MAQMHDSVDSTKCGSDQISAKSADMLITNASSLTYSPHLSVWHALGHHKGCQLQTALCDSLISQADPSGPNGSHGMQNHAQADGHHIPVHACGSG